MRLVQSELIEIRRSNKHGRGVFARQFIPRGTVIEKVPVLVFPEKDLWSGDRVTGLYHYAFEWSRGKVALALGYGSIYNHSYTPNARYDDIGRHIKVFTAIVDIQPGEEITVNYNGEPDDCSPMEFPVI
jgi:SET domain-containing protein